MTLFKSEKGQISIFFSASLVVLVSIIAFVINVGLFVKAKINLHNATDAAAYAGASVQARQLTKIAYLNWEMRNIFKEWMYKYYVVGTLNVSGTNSPSGQVMNFRLDNDENVITGGSTADPFNIPAVCIHIAGSQTNVCKRYAVPGLPEFGGYNLPGAEEASRAFIDSLIGAKVNDCVERSKLNMFVASTWAFNVKATQALGSGNVFSSGGPAILADRQGAWPQAVELAMRIRNLEKVVNRDALTGGVCSQKSSTGQISCERTIDEILQQPTMGNERIIKAFYSGYRNLTTTHSLDGSEADDEMKATFTLKELSPRLKPADQPTNNSSFLIPKPYPKQWLDLKLMMVNYATFFSALIPRADSSVSGACDISKVAIPVPGYPLGFYKNPDVVTYYAVKGESEFLGMFNPFNAEAVKLTAYSAAKPMGGRIGPMLFYQKDTDQFVRGREDAGKFRSVPYLVTLNFLGTPIKIPKHVVGGATVPEQVKAMALNDYAPGAPLPINFTQSKFWVDSADDPVGGKDNNNQVYFGVPNLAYDFEGNDYTSAPYANGGGSSSKLAILRTEPNPTVDFGYGLYAPSQFTKFKGSISGSVTPDMLKNQIARVRAATNYEAANYLIPTPFDFNFGKADAFGFIHNKTGTLGTVSEYQTHVYAPLYSASQTDVLWTSSDEVVSTIFDFMMVQQSAIRNYITSLNYAARSIHNMSQAMTAGAAGSAAAYTKAADGISDVDVANPATNLETAWPKSCTSLAGQFLHYYYGHSALLPVVADKSVCPVSLGTMLTEYFASKGEQNAEYYPEHYNFKYYLHNDQSEKIFSAYTPGPFTGVDPNGTLRPPWISPEPMRRNFYSTKFITLESVQGGKIGFDQNVTNFVIYSEGDLNAMNLERSQKTFENRLESSDAGLSSVKY